MKNSPLIGVLAGIILVLLVVVFSLGYHFSKQHQIAAKETTARIKSEEKIDNLSKELEAKNDLIKSRAAEINRLKTEVEQFQAQVAVKDGNIEKLREEIDKLNRLKEKLEENLKDELVNQDNP